MTTPLYILFFSGTPKPHGFLFYPNKATFCLALSLLSPFYFLMSMCMIGGFYIGDLVGHLPPEFSAQIAILLKQQNEVLMKILK